MQNFHSLNSCYKIFLLLAFGIVACWLPAHAQTVKRSPAVAGVQVDHQSGQSTESITLKSAVITLVTRSQGMHDVEASYVMIDGKTQFELSQHLSFIDVDPANDIAVIDEYSPGSGCNSLYHIVYKNRANRFAIKSFDWACDLNAIEYSPQKMVLHFKQYATKTDDYQLATGVLIFP